MTVYFVYRSPYNDLKLNQLKSFEDKTILAWFQRNWRPLKDHQDPQALVHDFMGDHIYGFESLFQAIGERDLKPPNSTDELAQLLDKHLQLEAGEIFFRPHALQAMTDDDELQVSYYLFDNHFLSEHPGKAAFLKIGICRTSSNTIPT